MTSPLGPPPLPHPAPYAAAPHHPHDGGPVRAGDVVATVLVLLVLALAGLLVSAVGVAGLVAVDQDCRPDECTRPVAFLGAAIATAASWVALLGFGTWAVVRLVRRRSAWWVALLALPVGALLFAAGVLVVVVAGG